jgi:MFS family permease
MTPVLTNTEKIRRLPWNTALNATNSVYAQLTFFGPSFVLFLNELKFTNTQIGFLLSLIPFTGLIALIIAPAVARFGYKRTWLIFYGSRKVVTAGLLLVPFVQAQFGISGLLLYVTLIVGGFAICRSIAETAMFPWAQEFIPNNIRGRYSAINDIMARLTGIAALGVGSYVLGLSASLDRFMLLFAIGIIFGGVSVWASSHIPGGTKPQETNAPKISHRHLARVLRDRNFLLYMAALGLLIIGSTPMGSFLPLFMEQQVGLSDSNIVLLQIATLIGGLSSTYLVGWAADRYGSKPVMLSGLYIKILLPLTWMLMPRHSDLSLILALVIAFVNGAADIAWAIGSGRLLYVRVVPSDKSAEYMAVYYALVGLIGGLSQVIGGRVLDFTQGLSGQFLIFSIDPFFPLFVFGIVLTIISVVLFTRVKADSPVSLSEFAGLFIHGNPVLALESVFRYYRARDERQTIAMTERMGQTKSRITVDELLEALKDPRFNVRFEAIISIARTDHDPKLIKALCQIVDGTELSLSVVAAWALGRIGAGDEQALTSLRHGLDSQYRSIQAHCARALGTLRDTSIAPMLLERLKAETDKGLRIAYSSALGNLRSTEAIPVLLNILAETENEGARIEVALALGRIIGHEHHFIRLLRQMRQDKGTAISQALVAAKRRLGTLDEELSKIIEDCADTFALDDFEGGVILLSRLIRLLPSDVYHPEGKTVLEACATRMDEVKAGRMEYILLTLHTLDVGVP